MFRKIKGLLNNLVVIMARKKDSSRKTFYELEKIAYKDSAAFMYERMAHAVLFNDIYKFWTYSLEQTILQGALLEFGVFSGHSINFFSSHLKNKNDKRIIYGFDSFEGLSETWGGTTLSKGYFNVKGVLPEVNQNVHLIKGWIDETYPRFVNENELEKFKIAFIHIDVDTYTPTKIILEQSRNYFSEGTIIVFDELLGYPGWRDHEYKALIETIDAYWNYEYIAFCETRKKDYTSEFIRAAIRITTKNKSFPKEHGLNVLN